MRIKKFSILRRPAKERGERKKSDGGNVTEKVNKMGNNKRGDTKSGEGGTSVCYIKINKLSFHY